MAFNYTLEAAIVDVLALKTEILLFLVAIIIHVVVFGVKRAPKRDRCSPKNSMEVAKGFMEGETMQRTWGFASKRQATEPIASAYQQGNYQGVIGAWNAAKDGSQLQAAQLVMVHESMQRLKFQSDDTLSEFKSYLTQNVATVGVQYMNDLLEPVARSSDVVVVSGLVEIMRQLKLQPNAKTYEILLRLHFGKRGCDIIAELDCRMRVEGVEATSQACLVLLKSAMHAGSFDDAMRHYKQLKAIADSSPPQHLDMQLIELGLANRGMETILAELESGGIHCTTEIFNVVLAHSSKCQAPSTDRVSGLLKLRGVEKNCKTFEVLLRNADSDRQAALALFDEMLALGRPDYLRTSTSLVLVPLCPAKDIGVAQKLYELIRDDAHASQGSFACLLRFFSEAGKAETAVEIYTKHMRVQQGDSGGPMLIDTQKGVLKSALQCDRKDVVKELLETALAAGSRYLGIIYEAGSNMDLAFRLVVALEGSAPELTEAAWNCAVKSCGDAGDLSRMEALLSHLRSAGALSQQTCDAALRAYLSAGHHGKAWDIIEEMRKAKLPPNHVNYNYYLNFFVAGSAGSGLSNEEVWEVWEKVEAMQRHGVKPNCVTCSILLKLLRVTSEQDELEKLCRLIDGIDEPADEVLVSSLAECYARVGRPKCLADKLQQMQETAGSTTELMGAHTFGSLIKACGQRQDLDGAWKYWNEMKSRGVVLTSITIGCMVEAVVANGQVDMAHALLLQLLGDPATSGKINCIIFGSVLRGYGKSQRMDQMWAVFQVLQDRRIAPSPVTYNTLLDACARSNTMERVPDLLREMEGTAGCQPNPFTYSTVIKGYIFAGDFKLAMEMLARMRKQSLTPDLVLYNTLLDGCGKTGLLQEGKWLYQQMMTDAVSPNNFTLTLLPRIFVTPNGNLDEAFNIIDSLSQKYRLKADRHVTGSLIEACVTHKQLARGAAVMERMLRKHIFPQPKHVEQLLRALAQSGQANHVATLLKQLLAPSNVKQPETMDDHFLVELLNTMAATGHSEARIASKLHAELVASRALAGPLSQAWTSPIAAQSKKKERSDAPCRAPQQWEGYSYPKKWSRMVRE